MTVDVLLRFPLSSLPSFLHRRRGRSLFWVQRSPFPSPSVVQVVVPVVLLSCFFLVCRSDAAGSVSPPCWKFDVVVVLLAGGASRALLRTTRSVVSCLLCFVCCGWFGRSVAAASHYLSFKLLPVVVRGFLGVGVSLVHIGLRYADFPVVVSIPSRRWS